MNDSCEDHTARVVVVGIDESGQSGIVSDEVGAVRFASPAITSTTLWESDSLPPRPGPYLPPDAAKALPASGGLRVMIIGFAPGDVDLHQTPTLDLVTVISGEIYAVTESGEVALRQGDTLIQPGGRHGWSNRSGAVAVVHVIMIGAS